MANDSGVSQAREAGQPVAKSSLFQMCFFGWQTKFQMFHYLFLKRAHFTRMPTHAVRDIIGENGTDGSERSLRYSLAE